jgi:hypothetical protein
MYLPTLSAVAVWSCEVTGQLSDGAWENAQPSHHWEFWSGLDAKLGVGPARVVSDERAVKTGYNIAGLYQYVGDRMLAYGRMGRVLEREDVQQYTRAEDFEKIVRAAEYMPTTLDAFRTLVAEAGTDRLTSSSHYLKAVHDEVAKAFYATTYEMKDLRRDVASIKAAMKTAGK